MLTYLLADQNFPFSVAIAIVLAIAVLEGVLTVLGFGMSAFLDGLNVDLDVDIPDVDADIDADLDGPALDVGNSFGSMLAWLRFGEVPAIVLLIIFLSAFGAIGFALQGMAKALLGSYLMPILPAVPAVLLALPVVRVFGGTIGRFMPKEETSAVGLRSLVGRIATITLGTASNGRPAQGKVRDQHGLEHYVMIEPDVDEQTFVQGNEVLLVRYERSIFFAIANEHEALSRTT